MTNRLRATPLLTLAALTALAAVLGAAPADAAKAGRSRTWAMTFHADTLGQAPAGTKVMSGVWKVIEDSTASPLDSTGALPRILRQEMGDEAEAAHAIRFARPSLGDGEVAARFRIVSGELDPSVGVLTHLDAKGRSGYLIRISGATSEIIAHYLLRGKRRDVKFVEVEPPAPGEWHTLAVRRDGITLIVLYDGVERMRLREERFREGIAGLWTEDDTVADFAELSVTVR
jgi:hypothetical protein